MAIEHASIPESGLHEPKGASTASSDTTYVSDGAGSGNWKKVDANALQGTVQNSNVAGLSLVSDGAGGFKPSILPGTARASMNLTQNGVATPVTAATDPTLATNSDYVEVALAFGFTEVQDVSTGANSLTIDVAGTYRIDFWANAKSSANASTVAVKFAVNGTDFVNRRPKLRLPNAGDVDNLAGSGIHTFAQGDEIKLYVACNNTADIIFEDAAFTISLLEASE